MTFTSSLRLRLRPEARRQHASFRPRLETLEDRTALSTMYGLTDNNFLVRFDSASSNHILSASYISGLGANETIVGIDFRPQNGHLYGLGVTATGTGTLYDISVRTGRATQVGSTPVATNLPLSADFGFDFNPAADALRIVTSQNDNFRVNPETGALISQDADLIFTQPAAGPVTALAYDHNFDGTRTTTLYGIDVRNCRLVMQGSANGTPNSPNGGLITDVGPLNIGIANGHVGFDIEVDYATGQSVGWAVLDQAPGNAPGLFRINLNNGAAVRVGAVGDGNFHLIGLAVAPPAPFIVAGAGVGLRSLVHVMDGATGQTRFLFEAYAQHYRGGVRVAVADVNGDGVPDIITAPNKNFPALVKVFSGVDRSIIRGFFAFPTSFLGGVSVAAGDVNHDGFDDIIVGAGVGPTGGHVKVFSGQDNSLLRGFLAYPGFGGGVNVAAGDVNADGFDDIITGAGPGAAGGHVKVFSGQTHAELASFFAFAGFKGGVTVAGGDVNGDGFADIIVGAGPGATGGHVKVFSGQNTSLLRSFLAFPGFGGGVTVGSVDRNSDGRADILAGAGAGNSPHVKAFDGLTLAELDSFFAFAPNFTGGVFVAGSR